MNHVINEGTYRVLARAYRPTKLSELIGQDALVRTLTNAIGSGRLAHAYLLSGIRGIGKTTTARIIARALNCTGPDDKGGPTPEPCGECSSCRAIAEDRAVDVIEMDAASHTGKGDILELMDGVHYAPASARYKVYIFDEVHMLSEKAWNALLKTIEEPPPHVKFIFATTEIRKVPVTVLSRCQRFELRRVAPNMLSTHLAGIAERESIDVSQGALKLIAQSGEGSVRDALSLLDQAVALSDGQVSASLVQEMLALGDRHRLLDLYHQLACGNAAGALAQFTELFDAGADPIAVINDLLELAHVLSRNKLGISVDSGFTATDELRDRCQTVANDQTLEVLARAWQMLLKGLDECRTAPDSRDATEMLLIRLASVRDLPPPGDLARLLGREPVQTADHQMPRHSLSRKTEYPLSGEPLAVNAPSAVALPTQRTAPMSLDALVRVLRTHGEQVLAARLHQSTHLLGLEPGRLELRIEPDLPNDFANKLSTALTRCLGSRWVVAIGTEAGAPTLAEQEDERRRAAVKRAQSDPGLQGLIQLFPGASLVDVRPDEDANSDDEQR